VFESDPVAERLQLLSQTSGLAARIHGMGIEVVGSQVCVVDAVAHDVPGGDQDVVSESDFGAFLAAPAGQPSIPCRQIRVLGAGGGGRGLAQRPAQPPILNAEKTGELRSAAEREPLVEHGTDVDLGAGDPSI